MQECRGRYTQSEKCREQNILARDVAK